MNGEHCGLAGAGFHASMVHDASRKVKKRIGCAADIWSGDKNLSEKAFEAKIDVDGECWPQGKGSCILFGNVRTISGGSSV